MKQVNCVEKEALVAYIYGECDADARQSVDAHLAACPDCADEVAGLGGVRQALAQWTPPATAAGFRIVRDEEVPPAAGANLLRPARWWQRPLPAWGRAAAAVLLLAFGAALANLDVRYGAEGLVVRTGWQHDAPPAPPRTAAPVTATAAAAQAAPWRGDLVALERELRGDFASQLAAARVAPRAALASASDDREIMTRVRALVDNSIVASEQRQQREFAYRVAQLQGEVGAQRQADLIRLQQGLWGMQGRTGAEVAQQRQLINYLLMSQSK